MSDLSTLTAYVSVTELPLQGMITLRADLAQKSVATAVKAITGLAMPAPREIVEKGGYGIAWMSHDEVMILCPAAECSAHVATLDKKLAKLHHLALDMSDARAVFEITAPNAGALRDTLAKLMPADFHPDTFGMGELRRSRVAQAAAAVWLTSPKTARLFCFRSVAQYVHDLLRVSGAKGGEVGYF
ncbi:sarcosine oxidase subunit gamma [Rhodobacteraceae bacterium XHP0102]|nr:sarcosine oxidase subunit gamma [Rhodobacteraceae bacterium XHP0102]